MPHNKNQKLLDSLYEPLQNEIHQTLACNNNELYGEIYYYSIIQLLKHINISNEDRFIDIGSGVGKLCICLYLLTNIKTIYGIEINENRHKIAAKALNGLLKSTNNSDRTIHFESADFLDYKAEKFSIAYLCSTIFSYELLEQMGKKLNSISSLNQIISFRKLPHLDNFHLKKKIFLHCSWDLVSCYIYKRNQHDII